MFGVDTSELLIVAILALLFIGLFPSLAAYLLWNLALRTVPPAEAG